MSTLLIRLRLEQAEMHNLYSNPQRRKLKEAQVITRMPLLSYPLECLNLNSKMFTSNQFKLTLLFKGLESQVQRVAINSSLTCKCVLLPKIRIKSKLGLKLRVWSKNPLDFWNRLLEAILTTLWMSSRFLEITITYLLPLFLY